MFAGANVVNHATGWLEGGLVTSFEKTIIDADLCGKVCRFFEGIDLSENAQAMDAIAATGPGRLRHSRLGGGVHVTRRRHRLAKEPAVVAGGDVVAHLVDVAADVARPARPFEGGSQ